jgi:hypothetical protein
MQGDEWVTPSQRETLGAAVLHPAFARTDLVDRGPADPIPPRKGGIGIGAAGPERMHLANLCAQQLRRRSIQVADKAHDSAVDRELERLRATGLYGSRR